MKVVFGFGLICLLAALACGDDPVETPDAGAVDRRDAAPAEAGGNADANADATVEPDATVNPDADTNPDATPDASEPDANADAAVDAGRDCLPNEINCDGTCVLTDSDPEHCGACGEVCPGTTCNNGVCSQTCRAGFTDCDYDLQYYYNNGCETDLLTDINNCGFCNFPCDQLSTAPNCTNGQCGINSCIGTAMNCDNDPINGCELETASSRFHCGACLNTCAPGQLCNQGTCEVLPTGDNCNTAITISAGTQEFVHSAYTNDYFEPLPSCAYGFVPMFLGDMVLSYTSPIDGFVHIEVGKPSGGIFTLVASAAACGTTTPELACSSSFGEEVVGALFPVTANQTYTLYFACTDPFESWDFSYPVPVTVRETSCAAPVVPAVTIDPPANSTTADLFPQWHATFDRPINAASGVITITGNLGTSISYDLAEDPAQIFVSNDQLEIWISPRRKFPSGEQLTVSWSGLEDICGSEVPVPSWTVTTPLPPCEPGIGGIIGSSTTAVNHFQAASFSRSTATDNDPNGWVYNTGFVSFYRFSKDGTMAEDMDVPNRAGNLYPTLVFTEGESVYGVTNVHQPAPMSGSVVRITDNNGQTWANRDMVRWSNFEPSGPIRGFAAYGGRIYLSTLAREGVPTEIWSFDPHAAVLPNEAVLEATLPGYSTCSGLAIDAQNYYLACDPAPGPLLRIDRVTLATTVLTTAFNISVNQNVIHGDDLDADGLFDVLYFQTLAKENYYLCDPTGMPYAALHSQIGNFNNSNYGLAFDRGLHVLWSYDADVGELIRIE